MELLTRIDQDLFPYSAGFYLGPPVQKVLVFPASSPVLSRIVLSSHFDTILRKMASTKKSSLVMRHLPTRVNELMKRFSPTWQTLLIESQPHDFHHSLRAL